MMFLGPNYARTHACSSTARLDDDMKAEVLMATPCPKSLHGIGEKWIARNILQGLDSRQPMTAMTEKKSPG
jgi:hypothetical protein